MPTLNWIGKEAVVKHHKDVPFKLIEPIPELSGGNADSGNLIVQGDNLHALKALLPRYAGQVKCIYIDPPYNTGNEGWAYNDNVKSPEILKWLGEVVGREGETLDRHDRWLCMMYPRLLLLKQFLREDGAIFVSIDDNEIHHLRSLMDEIFGRKNFIANIVWQKKQSPQNDAINLSDMHDHIVVYASRAKESRDDVRGWSRNFLPLLGSSREARYTNPDNDERGPWSSGDYTCNKSADERPNLYYAVTNPNTGEEVWPSRRNVWRYEQSTHERNVLERRIWWGANGQGRPRIKKFRSDVEEGVVPTTWWIREEFGDNQEGRRELRSIFREGETDFATPKPSRLIQRILQIATDKDSLILDSFAGSGTTGHAVLKQNSVDGGNRKFILVEMDEKIARDVTAERVRRVATGYTKTNGERVEGLGGGFQYYGLSTEPLFLADGRIRESVTFPELAEFVWFMETRAGQQSSQSGKSRKSGKEESAFLGSYKDRAVFLLYNGILKDKTDIGGNVLNGRTLEFIDSLLPDFEGERVIYGARTRFDKKKLASLGITFHQLPYDLAVKTWF